MKNYTNEIKLRAKMLPPTDGVRLSRLAIKHNISVIKIAACTGATRATVYNWYAGKGVTHAYQARVKQLTEILKTAPTRDAAWSTACSTFNLPL
jgi:predicted transcriptional regulator